MAFDREQLAITGEMSEIIRVHNECLQRLSAYREKYPYLMAPNLGKMMEENLKENIQVLYREMNNLHKPKAQQRRHICRGCHGVFAVSLPAGLCDECRSKGISSNATPPQEAVIEGGAARVASEPPAETPTGPSGNASPAEPAPAPEPTARVQTVAEPAAAPAADRPGSGRPAEASESL